METVIIDGGESKYIWDIVRGTESQDLPDNAMLNKVLTGCGGTTVALKNNVPYVVCVPYRALILNKLKWAKENDVDVCAVMGGSEGATDEQIANFTGNKYLVTYDSLGKMCNILGDRLSEYKVLIDESHKLIDSACFRGAAVQTVLDNFGRFNSFVFMTATPVKDKHQLPELRDIQKYEIKWDNILPVSIQYAQLEVTTSIEKNISVIALRHLQGNIEGNAHIFVNSVVLIIKAVKVLKKAGIVSPSDISIVCAKTDFNADKIKKELGTQYKISEAGTVKSINFYTSTAFEGCDIFDKTGRTYIVSDGKKDHTKINILTTLPQIIARVRDSIYRHNITLMYTPNQYYSNITADEYEITVKANIESAKGAIEIYNSTDNGIVRNAVLNDSYYNAYINVSENDLRLNTSAWYNEMHNFDTIHKTYYVRQGENNDGLLIHNHTDYNYTTSIDDFKANAFEKIKLGDKPDFKELCKNYCELATVKFSTAKATIAEAYPVIVEAYSLLGADKLKALEYRRKDIEKEMIIQDVYNKNCYKIVKLLDLRAGKWVSAATLKDTIQIIYSQLGIDKTAKATDISEWYNVTNCNKRLNGIVTRGINIITCNIKVN